MRLILILGAILFCSFLNAQTSAVVLSNKDSSTIFNANIRLVNSDIGWTTNSEGYFQANNIDSDDYLLISHVSYEEKMIQVADLSSPIFLKEKEIILDDVAVESQIDREWKRNYKIFVREMFGESQLAKEIQITNPWVVNFKKDDGVLIANSMEPIEIVNEATGYKLTLVLEYFWNKGRLSSFHGKPFFKEIENTDATLREETFKGSIRHFLFSLVHNITREEGYLMYECEYDQWSKTFVSKGVISPDQIIQKGDGNWEVQFSDFIKVVYLNEENPLGDITKPSFDESAQVSYLKCDSVIYVDKLGNVLNKGLEEFGYWANIERVAHWLPLNYLTDDLKSYLIPNQD